MDKIEYYQDSIKEIYSKKYIKLLDFNIDLIKLVCGWLEMSLDFNLTKDYKKNYLVFIKETINTKLKDGNNEYEKYLKISNSNLSNKILGTYDLYLNKKYKVDINQKALDKVKNMYR